VTGAGAWTRVAAITCLTVSCSLLAAGEGAAQSKRQPPVVARATRCSPHAPTHIPANPWRAARAQLAPPGADGLRLCLYSGLNGHPPVALVRSRELINRSRVSGLVRDFDRLPPPASGVFACPADDDSQIVAVAYYPRGRRVEIQIRLTGCRTVTNGDALRTAAGIAVPRPYGPALIAKLRRLLRGGPRPPIAGRQAQQPSRCRGGLGSCG
jgi:hypothetical protein